MGIKTDAFVTEIVSSFYTNLTENEYFIFGSDYNLSNTSMNSNFSSKDFLEKTIFGLRINDSDISYMIRNVAWTTGTIYEMYDDQSALIDENYFVVVTPESEDGDYYVFKCLFNNNDGASTSKPTYYEDIIDDGGNFYGADGYVWKYMYTVDSETVAKFGTTNQFPIVEDMTVANTAVDGIYTILVDNYQTNYGYQRVVGLANTIPSGVSGRVGIIVNDEYTFDPGPNYYAGSTAYVTKSEDSVIIASQQYIIDSSGISGQEFFINIVGYDANTFAIAPNDQIEILPRINITGNGSDAEAIAIFDETNTRITSIKMIENGSGYTSAEATVISPDYFANTSGVTAATLRPIISPTGGHGSNLVKELRSEAIVVSGKVLSYGTFVPDTFTYSKIGLVGSPVFVERDANNEVTSTANTPASFDNRLIITATATVTDVEAGDVITQASGVSGIVHEVVDYTIYVINYSDGNSAKFTADDPVSLGPVSINISEVTYPVYLERSGDVLYIADFQPITRDDTKEEVIKILFDF